MANPWQSIIDQTSGRTGFQSRGMGPNTYAQQLGQYNDYANDERDKFERARDDKARGRVEHARDRVYGLAEDRLREVRGDPIDAMILEQLQGRATDDVPYSEQTTNQMIASGNESAAARYNAGVQNLDRRAAAGGVSASDPAYQAQIREMRERQNAANIQNRRQVQSTAAVANHGAQGQALGQLGSQNAMTNSRVDNRTDRVGDLYRREVADVKDRGPELPSFNEWRGAAQQQPRQQTNMWGRRI